MKTLQKISFSELQNIPQLIKDFLSQKIDGFEDQVFTMENLSQLIDRKSNSFQPSQRQNLFQVLENQLTDLQLSTFQADNLAAIKSDNTFTITTGHQLNLFSGPAFFIYKILQTIKTADYLSQKLPEYNFVPMFWMATEDHDFEEIDHFKTTEGYYEINEQAGGAVGRIKITAQEFINEFEEEFKNFSFGTELILLLKKAYKKGNSLTEATRILVHYLFSDYGLLMIDGDDHDLKKEMIDIFEDELENQSLHHSSREKVEFLTQKYGKVQVNPREINLFYLSDTRNRIEAKGNSYEIIDKNLVKSREELLYELQEFPERFSPNALMRPVFQETVLPNLAYIGGNAEIMYWLELKDYFKKLSLPFPILIPRNSILNLTEKTINKLTKLDLKVEDFFGNFAKLVEKRLIDNTEVNEQLLVLEKELQLSFEKLKKLAEKTDITFGNLVKAEETRQLKSYQRFQRRLIKAEKIKQNELLARLENLFLSIHPSKIWQERVYNFSVFYAENGRAWLETCYEEIDVNRSELIILVD